VTLAAMLLGLGAWRPSSDQDLDLEGRAPTAEELQPSVEAAFNRESYAPGTTARLVAFGQRPRRRAADLPHRPGAHAHRRQRRAAGPAGRAADAPRDGPAGPRGPVTIGDWPSGLYFARLTAADGRAGFAPFLVHPRRLGEHRVAMFCRR
jgi:hypothetical protein